MSRHSPCVLIKKMITPCADENIRTSDLGLRRLLVDSLPGINVGEWPSATANDVDRFSPSQDLRTDDLDMSISLRGSRVVDAGTYLLVTIDTFRSSRKGYGNDTHAHDLAFVRRVLQSKFMTHGTVVIAQNGRDARLGGVVSGRQSDLFAYLLGSASGLDGLHRRGSEGCLPTPSFWESIAVESRLSFGDDAVVSISGTETPAFLRECFRRLAVVISREDFDRKYGEIGIYWRPRSPMKWSLSLLRSIERRVH